MLSKKAFSFPPKFLMWLHYIIKQKNVQAVYERFVTYCALTLFPTKYLLSKFRKRPIFVRKEKNIVLKNSYFN